MVLRFLAGYGSGCCYFPMRYESGLKFVFSMEQEGRITVEVGDGLLSRFWSVVFCGINCFSTH